MLARVFNVVVDSLVSKQQNGRRETRSRLCEVGLLFAKFPVYWLALGVGISQRHRLEPLGVGNQNVNATHKIETNNSRAIQNSAFSLHTLLFEFEETTTAASVGSDIMRCQLSSVRSRQSTPLG